MALPKIYQTDIPVRLSKSLSSPEPTILKAPTGYGKSVLLIDTLARAKKRSIIVIPNRPSVLALHSYTMKLFPKHKIGYKMHDDQLSTRADNVTLMTTGYFLEQITHNPTMLYQPLILAIDEAHESSWQTDLFIRIGMYMTKENNQFKLILASATLDINRYLVQTLKENVPGVPSIAYQKTPHIFIEIPDAIPSVTIHYQHHSSILQTIDLLRSLIGKNILMIFPGEQEIDAMLKSIEDNDFPKCTVRVLHSKLTQEEINEAVTINEDGWTIILSTNIVENSITIKGLRVVIDQGLRKVASQSIKGVTSLRLINASKSNLIQSSGRVGRCGTQDEVYLLMSKEAYGNLPDYPLLDVDRNPLYNQIFRLLRGSFPPFKIFTDPELSMKLNLDLVEMEEHRMIYKDRSKFKLTKLGEFISMFQLSLKSSRFLTDVLLNADEHIWYYGVIIACWIDNSGDIFRHLRRNYKESSEAYSLRLDALLELQSPYFLDDELTTALGVWITTCDVENQLKYSDAGLNGRIMNGWKKAVRNMIATLKKSDIQIIVPRVKYNIEYIVERLMYSLLKIYDDCIYHDNDIGRFHKKTIDRYSDRYYPECLSDEKFMALSSFEHRNEGLILSKLVKICKPIVSDKLLSKIWTVTGIPVEVWNKDILIYLDNTDIYNLIDVFSNYM